MVPLCQALFTYRFFCRRYPKSTRKYQPKNNILRNSGDRNSGDIIPIFHRRAERFFWRGMEKKECFWFSRKRNSECGSKERCALQVPSLRVNRLRTEELLGNVDFGMGIGEGEGKGRSSRGRRQFPVPVVVVKGVER